MKSAMRTVLKLAATACSAVLLSAAAPAFANTANSAATATTTASADMAAPVREAQGEVVDNGDARFKSLFSK